jgi:hypothetical protein
MHHGSWLPFFCNFTFPQKKGGGSGRKTLENLSIQLDFSPFPLSGERKKQFRSQYLRPDQIFFLLPNGNEGIPQKG